MEAEFGSISQVNFNHFFVHRWPMDNTILPKLKDLINLNTQPNVACFEDQKV